MVLRSADGTEGGNDGSARALLESDGVRKALAVRLEQMLKHNHMLSTKVCILSGVFVSCRTHIFSSRLPFVSEGEVPGGIDAGTHRRARAKKCPFERLSPKTRILTGQTPPSFLCPPPLGNQPVFDARFFPLSQLQDCCASARTWWRCLYRYKWSR